MLAIVIKGTVVLMAAFAAAALMRKRPAAWRHGVWTAALAGLLLLPGLAWLLRDAPVSVQIAAVGTTVSAVSSSAPSAASDAGHGPAPLAVVYGAGLFVAITWFLLGVVRTARTVRGGTTAAELGADVVIADVPMPLAWGIWRRSVVLPRAALDWPGARLRTVLLHERMHHERRDLVWQAVAQAACCLFWFHPLAWMALKRQREERERACDDAVLRQGIAAHDYAGHLMEVVRAAGKARRWSNAPAMAEGSNLETRIRAMLDATKDRRPLTRLGAAMVAAAVIAVLAPLAAVELRAQPGGGVLAGTVKDPSGGVVPGCRVTVKDAGGVTQGSTTTNLVGQYRIPAIAGGQYTLEFAMPGFKIGKTSVTLVGGATAQADFSLTVGQVSSAVEVMGRKSSPVTPKPQATGTRIKVGGNVQAAKLIRQPRPVYPPELQAAGVEGTVTLQTVILKDGTVGSIKVLKSAGNAALDEAAIASVKQWQYTPTLLNGEPVEVLNTIDIAFQLEQ